LVDVVLIEVSGFVHEVVLLDLDMDAVGFFDSFAVLSEDSSLCDQFAKSVVQKLIDVGLARLVLFKLLRKTAGNTKLLTLQETFEHHVDGEINVI
jgi:hypothetical protein